MNSRHRFSTSNVPILLAAHQLRPRDAGRRCARQCVRRSGWRPTRRAGLRRCSMSHPPRATMKPNKLRNFIGPFLVMTHCFPSSGRATRPLVSVLPPVSAQLRGSWTAVGESSFDVGSTQPHCGNNDLTCCCPADNAWFSVGVPNTVNLYAAFWNPPAGLRGLPALNYRAAIIIHEMLHMLFEDIRDVLHGRPRASCYEAFALRLAGFGAEPFDVCNCRGTPCPPNPFAPCP